MPERLPQQKRPEYSPGWRLLALAIEAVFFIGILPFTLLFLSGRLDHWLGWPRILVAPYNDIVGGLCILVGMSLAIWTVYVQFTIGRGTPAPVMPTQKLIVQAPYSYCRNPMALGLIVAFLGLSILIGSGGAALIVLTTAAVLLTYIRTGEEKELAARFGQEYVDYRRQTPFLIPRLRR